MAHNEHVMLDALMHSAVIQPVNEELVNHRARVSCSPTVRKATCILVMHFITCTKEITKRDFCCVTLLSSYATFSDLSSVCERDERCANLNCSLSRRKVE